MFLRQVPLKRVHLYTAVQFACLVALWVLKSFQQTSMLFPIMLVVMIGIRKLLDYVFTKEELKVLDDMLPEFTRKKQKEDFDEKQEKHAKSILKKKRSFFNIPLRNGAVMKLSQSNINLKGEMHGTED